jgi:hypothetical protein
VDRLLPRLDKQRYSAADSWEAAHGCGDELPGPGAGAGGLLSLRCLHWPAAPYSLLRRAAADCPLLLVNPAPGAAAAAGLPACHPPEAPLDSLVLKGKDSREGGAAL